MVFYTFVLQIHLKYEKNKKQKKEEEHNFLSKKKTEEKENSATIRISVDGKRTVFIVRIKLQGESSKKRC